MELHEALSQISDIRRQIARTETFRGYRSETVGFSGLMAFAAAGLQMLCIADPVVEIDQYLVVWLGVAVLSLGVTAWEMWVRSTRCVSSMTMRHTWCAVEQFLPCLFAGGAVTCVLYSNGTEDLWMLPGLWSVLFSLGVFASWRLLPKATFWVGAWYLLAGAACLTFARDAWALSPWAMAGTFGVGQLLAALILYATLERPDVSA